MTAMKKQYQNLKYQIPNPIHPHVYELHIVNAETGYKFELEDKLW